MSSKEFGDWIEFYGLEPFGDWRADHRTALLCAVLNHLQGNTNAKIENFMLFDEKAEKPREQTPEEMLAVIKTIGLACGVVDKR